MSTGTILQYMGTDRFLNRTVVSQETSPTVDKWDFMKLDETSFNFCTTEESQQGDSAQK